MPAPDPFGPQCHHRSAGDRHAVQHGVPALDRPGRRRLGRPAPLRDPLQHQPDRRGQLGQRNRRGQSAGGRHPRHARSTCTVTGLVGSTTYYFAVKSIDWAEPANVSAISNVVTGTTRPPVQPVTLHNPWIVNDRVADTRSLATLAATFGNAYTPDGVIPPSPTDNQNRHQRVQQLQAPRVPLGR